jgi:DNA-binding CsgD family transcriptional regulator
MATDIIGREDELDSIEAFLDGVQGGPRALVLSGEAGIGKTILWERGVEEARERLGRVLTCRGVEAEAALSFAALSELIAAVLEEAMPSLVSPRRRALEVALLLVEPGEHAPDPHAIGLAVLDVLRVLAEQAPVLVALDDAQWLDPASASALQLALRRLREEPVGVLATLRIGQDVPTPFVLERSFSEERLSRLSIGPLSIGAVHRLLEERLGLELTRPELARVREATAGNPFFALELGRELVRTGTRPAAGQALRVPESLRELLGGRLARLPAETVDVMLMIAALARPTVGLVSAAHGDGERVLAALEAAVREGVVDLEDSRIRFAHPLVASICYEQAPVWKRRAVHQALAEAVADIEERARHLALAAAGPDAAVAIQLDRAAEQSASRGATATAAELSELAAQLTPDDPILSRRRRLRAATFHRLAGEGDRAAALLEELLAEVPSGTERADVLFELGSTFRADRLSLIALCDEALAEAGDDDARSARILAHSSLHRLLAADIPAALADARASLEKAERVDDPALIATAIARLGHAESYGIETTPGLLERGVEIEERLDLALSYYESPRIFLCRRLVGLGEIDRACTIMAELESKAEARGDEGTRVAALWYQAMAEWFGGRLESALGHATVAHELGELTQFGHARAWVGRVRAYIETDLGLVDEARASALEGLSFAQASANESYVITNLAALGHLELALGNLEAAAGYLSDLPERLTAADWKNPANSIWPDSIETLISLGDLERAGAFLDRYEEYTDRSGNPYGVATGGRCRGLFAAAKGDFGAAFQAFERALAPPADRFPVELGRTLLCHGVVRRQAQQKKAAREALEQSLAIFEKVGARLWAEKARAELRRISGRRPADEELTETERRVAVLASQGRSNKEIAAELFMGLSTVEAHLSRVYRKLEVRSRTELARRLPGRAEPANAVERGAQA